jgi:hypothetical protein
MRPLTRSATTLITILLCGLIVTILAQEKGVDTQNSGIRDAASGNNTNKQDKGAGRGINFGKGKTPATAITPNPYRLTARREVVTQTLTDLLRESGIVIDEDTSRPSEGIIRTQSYVFAKGNIITKSELDRYAEAEALFGRSWTRARHILTIEIQPIDGASLNLSVSAKIEGRSDGPSGPEWITLRSNGEIERELINQLVEAITGASPAASKPPVKP